MNGAGDVLDVNALRTLTVIADAGGFRRAAEVLHLSQSAVSQHVRRLEVTCGRPLVERDGRGARFTHDGRLLLAEARKILAAHDDALTLMRVRRAEQAVVIGAIEHGADHLLPAVTRAVRDRSPDATLRYRIDRGGVIGAGLDDGTIDVAVLIGDVGESMGRAVGALPVAWFAAAGWTVPAGPVPVVAIEACTLRRRALASLAENGIDAAVVCEAGHLAGVSSAVRAGVGVALLADLGPVPDGLRRIEDLPVVAPEPLFVGTRAGVTVELVRSVTAAVREVVTAAP